MDRICVYCRTLGGTQPYPRVGYAHPRCVRRVDVIAERAAQESHCVNDGCTEEVAFILRGADYCSRHARERLERRPR